MIAVERYDLEIQTREHAGEPVMYPRADGEWVKSDDYDNLLSEVERLRLIQFSPTGDNHHNAALCPYCGAPLRKALAEVATLRAQLAAPLVWQDRPTEVGWWLMCGVLDTRRLLRAICVFDFESIQCSSGVLYAKLDESWLPKGAV